MRLISQLIKGISRVLQNYLNILMVPLLQHAPQQAILPVIVCLNLNEALLSAAEKLAIVPELVISQPVHLYSNAINLLMFLNNNLYTLLNYALAELHPCF